MQIIRAHQSHIADIVHIADITWNETYKTIIPQEQISYMLKLFYTESVLHQQMNDPKHHFWVLIQQEELVGYAHCIEDETDVSLIKLSKLYVLPQAQGMGIGKRLLLFIEQECVALNKNTITLNVNRANPAKDFYLNVGFEITQELDIPLDKFWLNDYIMEKRL